MIEIKSFRAADGGSLILCEIKICDEDCDEKRTYVVDEYDRDGFFLSDHLPICAFVSVP